MNKKELFSEIDRLFPQYVDFWKTICMMETPTSDKERIDAMGSYLKKRAEELGWEVEEHQEEASGNALCFTMNPKTSGIPVCLSAHMDTVHPVGSFGSIPVHSDGQRLYGPGVTDCKSGIAAGFLAMHALQAAGFSGRPVRLILQSDEEINSRTSQKRTVEFMKKMAEGSAAFLNLEPHSVIGRSKEDGEPAVIVRKGIMTWRFRIHGKAAHSARCQDGISAAAEAAHKILELEKMKSSDGLTCTCSLLEGGTAANVVPENCTFTADIRFANNDQMQEAEDIVRKTAERSYIPGSSCETELVSYRCPMEYEKRNEELLERMNEIYQREGLPVLKAAASAGGSDAADISSAGIPTVDSIGGCGGSIHSGDEWADIASLADCAKRIAIVVPEL